MRIILFFLHQYHYYHHSIDFLSDFKVSAKPEPQLMENTQEMTDRLKTKMQEAWNRAQEMATEALDRFRNLLGNTFETTRQNIEKSEFSNTGEAFVEVEAKAEAN